jgi:hypothetical protein
MEFRVQKTDAPLSCRPAIGSLFLKRQKRKYMVFIITDSGPLAEPVLMHNLPFNEQIGVLAHEICHASYYQRHSTLQMIKFGLQLFTQKKFMIAHEKSTDALIIYKGLGKHLYEYAYFVRNDESTKELFEKFGTWLDDYYMTPDEIKKIMSELPEYAE